jgi:hypothetical protein
MAKFYNEFVEGGELLVVAAAVIGPLMYPLLKQYGGEAENTTAPFPMNWVFIAGILLISLLTSGFFTRSRARIPRPLRICVWIPNTYLTSHTAAAHHPLSLLS